MEKDYYDNSEIEIDLIDLFKTVLLNRKWLILLSVIGLAGGLVLGMLKKPRIPAEEQKELCLEALTPTERENVENMYNSYKVMNSTLDALKQRMAYYQDDSKDLEGYVFKRTAYVVHSDVFGITDLLSSYTLSQEEYRDLSQIMFGDTEHPELVNRRVSIWATNDGRSFWSSGSEIASPAELDQVFQVRVFALSRDAADQATDYIEQKIREKQADYAGKNAVFTIERLDEDYSEMRDDVIAELNSLIDSLVKDMYTQETQINTFKTNYISKLTEDSATYYSILDGTYEEARAKEIEEGVSYAKYAVLGIALGLFLGAGAIVLQYILSGTVKTPSEMTWVLKGNLPYDMTAEGVKKAGPECAALAGEDLLIKEKQNNISKLYVITDPKGEGNPNLDAVLKHLESGAPISCGNPIVSAQALHDLSEADGAVIVAVLKKRKRKEIEQLEQYCRNSGVKILGVIAL